MKKLAIAIGCITLVLVSGYVWLRPAQSDANTVTASLSVQEALSGQDNLEGFERATKLQPLSFPADHGPHPEYKTEWWYYTGNLESSDGRQWGYQLAFFRNGLQSETRESNWKTNNVYMAHFTVTDVQGKQFFPYEKFSRDSVQLAGAQAQPYRVWVTSWKAEEDGEGTRLQATAPDGKAEINLFLRPTKTPVLQGDQGLSQKSAEAGNASYYYSVPRLATEGTITINGTAHQVQGQSWLDREWSTSSLNANQVGWDWFALHFEDGRELMYYQLRRADGDVEPLSSGILIAPDGSTTPISRDEIQIEVLDQWKSPATQGVYPSRWNVTIPKAQLQLEIIPLLANQELNVIVAYWEGAVQVQGQAAGQPIAGEGYVEMTGYTTASRGQQGQPQIRGQ